MLKEESVAAAFKRNGVDLTDVRQMKLATAPVASITGHQLMLRNYYQSIGAVCK